MKPTITKYHNKEAEHGAEFLVVYYSIRNNSKETTTVLSNDFKVMDHQNRSFSLYSGGSVYLGSDFLLSQLRPGLTKRIATVRSLLECLSSISRYAFA